MIKFKHSDLQKSYRTRGTHGINISYWNHQQGADTTYQSVLRTGLSAWTPTFSPFAGSSQAADCKLPTAAHTTCEHLSSKAQMIELQLSFYWNFFHLSISYPTTLKVNIYICKLIFPLINWMKGACFFHLESNKCWRPVLWNCNPKACTVL